MSYLILCSSFLAALWILRCAAGWTNGGKLYTAIAQTAGKREVQADIGRTIVKDGEAMFLLADGIGRGEKGRYAAQIAVDSVSRMFEAAGTGEYPKYFFSDAFRAANAGILRHIPDASAGASLLCAVMKQGYLYYALAGDCRLYLMRGGRLWQISEGQTIGSLARQAYRQGKLPREYALSVANDNRTCNFVGKDGFSQLEICEVPVSLKRGDRILLASDGVTQALTEQELAAAMRKRWSCNFCAHWLIAIVDGKKEPEQDNATVIVAKAVIDQEVWYAKE